MNRAGLTGVLGGTFDPIHLGHLAAAGAAADAMRLETVLFVPSNQPPHRTAPPRASAFHRFAMVALAVRVDERFEAADIELVRSGPSYTADTLRALHGLGYEASRLFFITGSDAFAEIATWRGYPAVLDLANFVVISRPGQSLDEMAARLPQLAGRMSCIVAGQGWHPTSPGRAILMVEANTPDVSSTVIRDQVAASGSLAALVPGTVEQHIRRHGLYTQTS